MKGGAARRRALVFGRRARAGRRRGRDMFPSALRSCARDYKDARALEKTDQKRNELCKDVSAFANSAGGQIIYGIQENGHHPVRVQDADAVSPADISREWVEQVIDSNIQPRIQNLRIQPIDVADDRVAYVITIPPATSNAPHQAPDKKYYYRQNFRSVPMEDWQVRDTMRRATTRDSTYLSRQGQSSRLSTRRTLKYPSRLRSRSLSVTALPNRPFILSFNWASTPTCTFKPLATSDKLVHVPMQTTFCKTGGRYDCHPRPAYQYSKNPIFAVLPLHWGFRPSFLTSHIFFLSPLPCRVPVTLRQRNGSSTSKVQP